MRILLVEDHPIFLEGLQFLLSRHRPHAEVAAASSAERALTRLDADPHWDLIILDLHLPGIDGIGFLLAMKERLLFLPTLTISAEIDSDAIGRAMEAGALGFVPKTSAGTELLNAIDAIGGGDTYLPDKVAARLNVNRRRRGSSGLPQPARDAGVTPRQFSVLKLLSEGFSNRQIAQSLSLTEHTVKSHVRGLFTALDAENRTSCVRRAESLGLLSPPL